MNREDVRQYQLAQLELMDATDAICKELGITYYLIGGTLLGAIRHKGFIPWDPDIDIAMPRADYERFREYWSSTESDRYFYQHRTTEKNHLSPHALLRIKGTHVVTNKQFTTYAPQYDGIYLDIFPLDTPPADKKLQEKQMKKIKKIKRIIQLKAGYIYDPNTGLIKRMMKAFVKYMLLPFSFPFLNKKLDAAMTKYNGCESGFLVSMASHYSYWKQLMPKEVYGEPVYVEYEGKQYAAPANTDDYLKRIYGDYMKLPPEDSRYSDLDSISHIDYGVKAQ